MAKDKKKFSEEVEPVEMLKVEEPKASQPEKIKFLVWFTGAMGRFNGVKAHHMGAIHSYFTDGLKLGEVQTEAEFDQGLIKFGFGRK